MFLINKDVIILLAALVFFFNNYNEKCNVLFFFIQIEQILKKITHYANSILPFEHSRQTSEINNISSDTHNETNTDSAIETKYEDKYLKEIKNISNGFNLNCDEEALKTEKCQEFINQLKTLKVENHLNTLSAIEERLLKYDTDENYYSEDSDVEEQDIEMIQTREERIKDLLLEKTNAMAEYDKLKTYLDSYEGQQEITTEALKLATEWVIDKKLETLTNCFVMEKTPLGNVLMYFNSTRCTFSYYSDSVIPYRYLEVVARKYVKTFHCKPIFIDMDEELKKAEEKWELEKTMKEKEEKKLEELKSQKQKITEQKKQVFAKFKSYNKDAAATKAMVAPPKNSILTKQLTNEQENEKILLKDNANRYTYEGKMSNFNFLKKINRKLVDKKYALSFSDFKQMTQKNDKS